MNYPIHFEENEEAEEGSDNVSEIDSLERRIEALIRFHRNQLNRDIDMVAAETRQLAKSDNQLRAIIRELKTQIIENKNNINDLVGNLEPNIPTKDLEPHYDEELYGGMKKKRKSRRRRRRKSRKSRRTKRRRRTKKRRRRRR